MGNEYEDLSLSFPILMGLLVPLLPTMLFLCWLRILGVALGLWRQVGSRTRVGDCEGSFFCGLPALLHFPPIP